MENIKIWKGKNDIGVIIIHGWTSYLRQINPLAKVLNNKGFLVYAPILSGHDTTPDKLESVTWQNWENDVLEAIRKMKTNKKIRKIFLIGVSFGGNLSILASQKIKVDGIILISTPIFLRDHYWTIITIKLLSYFKKNLNKAYPRELANKIKKPSSYNYFPVKSSLECFKIIHKSKKVLSSVKAPFFIIQTNKDYLVAPYSPWLMYNKIKSKKKSLCWIEAGEGVHIDFATDPGKYGNAISNFVKNNS